MHTVWAALLQLQNALYAWDTAWGGDRTPPQHRASRVADWAAKLMCSCQSTQVTPCRQPHFAWDLTKASHRQCGKLVTEGHAQRLQLLEMLDGIKGLQVALLHVHHGPEQLVMAVVDDLQAGQVGEAYQVDKRIHLRQEWGVGL